MNAFAILAVLLAATSVLAQNPYEYVDDALIQKVGQIVYEYDQKVAASRSAGGANNAISNNFDGEFKPEPVARASHSNFGRSSNVNYVPQQQQQRQQRQYNVNQVQVQRQNYVQPQQQVYRSQQNYVQPAVQAPVARNYQHQQPSFQQVSRPVAYEAPRTYQAPAARTYDAPRTYQAAAPVARTYEAPRTYQAPVARTYEQPIQQQQQVKSGFTGYSLNQPEVVARVAEWHFSDGQEVSADQAYRQVGQMSRGLNNGVQHNNDFRMV